MERREHWSSRIGFVLAAAGSAVGLGNLWKFPYITYDNRGGSFVLVYLLCIAVVGLPIMIAEILIGRRSGRNLVGAFRVLKAESRAWQVAGWLGIATGFIILSYYSVVAGWTIEYALRSLSGYFDGMEAAAISAAFVEFLGDPLRQVLWHAAFMTMTLAVVISGIARGIERWARILMPMLLLMLVGLLCYSLIAGDAVRAFGFLFNFTSITAHGVLEALGHAFFTLSLGMGVMVTYGSYISRDVDLGKMAIMVTVLDTLVAMMACMVLYPIIFAYDLQISESIGIIFTTLPFVFQEIPLGAAVAPLFFCLMAFAALTSTISLLEVVVSYGVDELRLSRRRSAVLATVAIFLLGVPSALCNGGVEWISRLTIFSKGGKGLNWLDSFDYLASNWLLAIGGLLIALFAGWALSDRDKRDELEAGGAARRYIDFRLWNFLIRYVSPVAVLIVLLYKIGVLNE
jgi:NSS family neurotransmitter:Na+ symporter